VTADRQGLGELRPTRSTGATGVTVVQGSAPADAVTTSMLRALRRSGVRICLLRLGTRPVALTAGDPTGDLYVLRHDDAATLAVGATLHAAGAATFNPHPVVAACRDRSVATRLLASAGIPVPESWFVDDPAAAVGLLDDGPIVVKANCAGSGSGSGMRIVRLPLELREVSASDGPFLVQRHHPPDGLDRRLHRIGDDVFCLARKWPATTRAEKMGVLVEVDAALRRLAVEVGEALGTDVFDADVVTSAGRPCVVGVSATPDFAGVPEAGPLLAARVLAAARQGDLDRDHLHVPR
jgi:ribosomal protein S6--L-glutamate ligase